MSNCNLCKANTAYINRDDGKAYCTQCNDVKDSEQLEQKLQIAVEALEEIQALGAFKNNGLTWRKQAGLRAEIALKKIKD